MIVFPLIAVILVLLLFTVLAVVKNLIIICPPNKVAVISGRSRELGDGRSVGYRVLKGGRTIRVPLLEKIDYMDLNTIPIEVSVTSAYSKGAIPIDVQGVANIKVSSSEGLLENSVERFLGRNTPYIGQIAKENLEANLRGVLSTLTPEEVNEDRLKFAQTLIEEADDDIKTLGLELDVLKIQNVTDQVGYLDAVGRRRTAQILKEARESEAQQTAAAEVAEAASRQRSQLARIEADLAIAEETNKLRVRQAELDAEAVASEREAEVAGERAQAVAEQSLEAERIELQKRRYEADVVTPARANFEAAELDAKGKAAPIIEDGMAQVEIFEKLAEQYRLAGPDAQRILVLNMLPELVAQIVDTVRGIDIDKLTVIDTGQGNGVGSVASQLPAAVISISEQIANATGVDLLEALAGHVQTPSQSDAVPGLTEPL